MTSVTSSSRDRERYYDFQSITLESNFTIEDMDMNQLASGKGAFANRDMDVAEVITRFTEPYLMALDTPRLLDTCYKCHMQPSTCNRRFSRSTEPEATPTTSGVDGSLKSCSGCKVVRYCDLTCQRKSWKEVHKFECKLFASLSPRILPTPVRAIARLLLLGEAGRVSIIQWTMLTKCVSHMDKIKREQPSLFENIEIMAGAAIGYTKSTVNFKEVVEMFCRMMMNSVTLMTYHHDPIGLAMHPVLAKFNHSCNPNAYVEFRMFESLGQAPHVIVIPLREIKMYEEITINYIEVTKPYLLRQEELSTRYFFNCHCSKCQIGEANPQKEQQELVQYNDITSKIERLQTQPDSSASPSKAIDTLKQAIRLLLNSRAESPTDPKQLQHPYPDTIHKLVVSCLEVHQYNLATALSAVEYFDIDPQLHTPLHPTRLIHQFLLHRLTGLLLDNLSQDQDQSQPPQLLDLKPYDLNFQFWNIFLSQALLGQLSKYATAKDLRSCLYSKIRSEHAANPPPREILELVASAHYRSTQMTKMEKLKKDVYAELTVEKK